MPPWYKLNICTRNTQKNSAVGEKQLGGEEELPEGGGIID